MFFLNDSANHWSTNPHPSHVITHGTTDDFDDTTTSTGKSFIGKILTSQWISTHILSNYYLTDEFQSDSKRRKFSTFNPSNTPTTATFHETDWNGEFRRSMRDGNNHFMNYSAEQKRLPLYTRSIDRREILRRNEMADYAKISELKYTDPSLQDVSVYFNSLIFA